MRGRVIAGGLHGRSLRGDVRRGREHPAGPADRLRRRVHLDKVNLALTGGRSGGALGSLFCSLADAKRRPPARRRG
jgi:hypothetical protein